MFGFIRRRFSEERWESFDQRVSAAFERVKSDTSNIFSWVNYLREKDITNDEKHQKINYVLGTHNAMIKSLQNEIILLKKEVKSIKINSKVEKITEGQVRTPQRTFKGHLKDMSPVKKIAKKSTETSFIDKSSLPGSQIELINFLYNSERPVGYEEISRRLSKSTKSIRNLIYELRKKGIEIKDKPIAVREKGFYLERTEKIKISGR